MKYFFAFPYAGAGKNAYEIWNRNLSVDFIFHQISYNNSMDSCQNLCDSMEEAVKRASGEILSIVSKDDEIYFFGHCMGASVAYETAAYLQQQEKMSIKGLFFSAFISPDVPIEDGISWMNDEEFAREIQSHNVFPEEFFVNKSILKLFLPKIRADYKLIENYCDRRHLILDCPIVGFYGKDDDMVLPEETSGWRKYTSKQYICYYFEGNHYFFYSKQKEIIELIRIMISQFEKEI